MRVCKCGFCKVWVCVCVGFVMCGCVYVWVCVCVGFVMCGEFENCVGVLVKCVLVYTVFFVLFRLCIFIFNILKFYILLTVHLDITSGR